jgi:phage terminase large subunit-like protein
LVVSQRVRHDHNPVMRWCMANVAVREDAKGNIYPRKPSATKRIDGAVAAIIALSRLIVMPEKRPVKRRGARLWTPHGFVSLVSEP